MVERSPLPVGTVHMKESAVREFVVAALMAVGVLDDDALLVTDVLVSADMRGIRSHGVARLPFFLRRLQQGILTPNPEMTFSEGSDTTGVLDANRGLGLVAANQAMTRAMSMARSRGAGFVVVKNSSHFGYAGYWADMARKAGFIGISMANGVGKTAPTFGIEEMLGTNPISVAIPGGTGGTDFYLDMATSAVAVGKVETAVREGRTIPPGWISSASGVPRLDDVGKLEAGFPLLPLGGEGDDTGGHKGYGLSLMIELLCGALGGSPLSARIAGAESGSATAIGHFMGAISVSGFRDREAVAADMQETFDVLRASSKAPGQDRIYIPGEIETLAEIENRKAGIPIPPKVLAQMRQWDNQLDLGFDWPLS